MYLVPIPQLNNAVIFALFKNRCVGLTVCLYTLVFEYERRVDAQKQLAF